MRPSSVAAGTDRSSVRPGTRGRVLALVAIVCAALNLRLVVTSLSPLLTTVGEELGFTATVVGVFGTLPLVAFAIFGLVTPAIMRRLGAEATATLSMLLTGIGQVLRAFAPDTGALLALTGIALTGAALGNVVLPPLIKQYFPDRIAALSTVQMVAIHLGALFPPLMAVPLAEVAGWRGAGALSGFVQGAGSGIALGGPLLFGLLGELTGGWTASYVLVAGGSLVVAGVVAYVERTPWTIEAAARGRRPDRRRSELPHD